jgi:hypothetical protein
MEDLSGLLLSGNILVVLEPLEDTVNVLDECSLRNCGRPDAQHYAGGGPLFLCGRRISPFMWEEHHLFGVRGKR